MNSQINRNELIDALINFDGRSNYTADREDLGRKEAGIDSCLPDLQLALFY